MKFTINSGDLLQRLNVLAKAQASKSSIAILEYVKIVLNQDNINMTTCDDQVRLITSMPVLETEDVNQSICVKTDMLISALRELPNQPITITANDMTLEVVITYNGGKFNFVGLSAETYPETTPSMTDAKTLQIPVEIVRDGVQSAKIAVAYDELRPIMNGIYFDAIPEGLTEGLTFVASDGHRLVRNLFLIKQESPLHFVLPTKSADILLAIINKQTEDVNVEVNEKNIIFKTPDYTFMSRLIEGNYPNYNSVIPPTCTMTARMDRDALIAALRRVLVFANTATALVALDFQNNTMKLSAQDLDFSKSSEESVICEYDNTPISIGFKGDYLLELLKSLPCGDITINMIDPSKAAIIKPAEQAENNDLLLLLMPMMLNQ